MNDGTVKVVDDPRDLIDDVFSTPQRLNPGNITHRPQHRDAGWCRGLTAARAAPQNCDTAVFTESAGGVHDHRERERLP